MRGRKRKNIPLTDEKFLVKESKTADQQHESKQEKVVPVFTSRTKRRKTETKSSTIPSTSTEVRNTRDNQSKTEEESEGFKTDGGGTADGITVKDPKETRCTTEGFKTNDGGISDNISVQSKTEENSEWLKTNQGEMSGDISVEENKYKGSVESTRTADFETQNGEDVDIEKRNVEYSGTFINGTPNMGNKLPFNTETPNREDEDTLNIEDTGTLDKEITMMGEETSNIEDKVTPITENKEGLNSGTSDIENPRSKDDGILDVESPIVETLNNTTSSEGALNNELPNEGTLNDTTQNGRTFNYNTPNEGNTRNETQNKDTMRNEIENDKTVNNEIQNDGIFNNETPKTTIMNTETPNIEDKGISENITKIVLVNQSRENEEKPTGNVLENEVLQSKNLTELDSYATKDINGKGLEDITQNPSLQLEINEPTNLERDATKELNRRDLLEDLEDVVRKSPLELEIHWRTELERDAPTESASDGRKESVGYGQNRLERVGRRDLPADATEELGKDGQRDFVADVLEELEGLASTKDNGDAGLVKGTQEILPKVLTSSIRETETNSPTESDKFVTNKVTDNTGIMDLASEHFTKVPINIVGETKTKSPTVLGKLGSNKENVGTGLVHEAPEYFPKVLANAGGEMRAKSPTEMSTTKESSVELHQNTVDEDTIIGQVRNKFVTPIGRSKPTVITAGQTDEEDPMEPEISRVKDCTVELHQSIREEDKIIGQLRNKFVKPVGRSTPTGILEEHIDEEPSTDSEISTVKDSSNDLHQNIGDDDALLAPTQCFTISLSQDSESSLDHFPLSLEKAHINTATRNSDKFTTPSSVTLELGLGNSTVGSGKYNIPCPTLKEEGGSSKLNQTMERLGFLQGCFMDTSKEYFHTYPSLSYLKDPSRERVETTDLTMDAVITTQPSAVQISSLNSPRDRSGSAPSDVANTDDSSVNTPIVAQSFPDNSSGAPEFKPAIDASVPINSANTADSILPNAGTGTSFKSPNSARPILPNDDNIVDSIPINSVDNIADSIADSIPPNGATIADSIPSIDAAADFKQQDSANTPHVVGTSDSFKLPDSRHFADSIPPNPGAASNRPGSAKAATSVSVPTTTDSSYPGVSVPPTAVSSAKAGPGVSVPTTTASSSDATVDVLILTTTASSDTTTTAANVPTTTAASSDPTTTVDIPMNLMMEDDSDISDSQLCSVDLGSPIPSFDPSEESKVLYERQLKKKAERGKEGRKLLQGFIKDVSDLNSMITQTKNEIEAMRRRKHHHWYI